MDSFEQLRTLKQLLDEGILSQEEFDKKKKEILDGATAPPAIPAASGNTDANRNSPGSNSPGTLSAKGTAILSYIGILFWVIAYAIGDKEGAKFHLNQSLVINLGMLLCIIPVIGWIWAIFMVVVWIMGLVYAINDQEKEVPLLGKIKLLN